jgi:hypothetical protein
MFCSILPYEYTYCNYINSYKKLLGHPLYLQAAFQYNDERCRVLHIHIKKKWCGVPAPASNPCNVRIKNGFTKNVVWEKTFFIAEFYPETVTSINRC